MKKAILKPVDTKYILTDHSFYRNGILVHLDCMSFDIEKTERNILLVHGVTYSSHEFDIDYQDYSLVRFLVRNGYNVWRIDITGFGQSGEVEDGFLPDTNYAADDINAAVNEIVRLTGKDKIDVLGWSWGTVTSSRYAVKYPEHLKKLILYAPVVTGHRGTGEMEPFHHNDWIHAAGDFQLDENGEFDYNIADPVIIDLFCSSCWYYDGEYSPNGGRRDLFVNGDEIQIDFASIKSPTLLIYGDHDRILNFKLLENALDKLPEGSENVCIHGAAHAMLYEKPFYREFQDTVKNYLLK